MILTLLEKWKALHRIIVLMAAAILSKVFWEEALDRTVEPQDYVYYSFAMVFTYSTTLATKILDTINNLKGKRGK